MIILILGFLIIIAIFSAMIFIENYKRKGKSDLEDYDPMDPNSVRELQNRINDEKKNCR